MVGSVVMGLLAGAAFVGAGTSTVGLLAGTGFCGALTTYSTPSYETARLAEQRARSFAGANIVVSIIAGIGGVTTGYAVGLAIVGRGWREVLGPGQHLPALGPCATLEQ